MTSPLSADPPSSRSPSVASHQVRPPDLCLWASIAGVVGCVKSEPCSGMCTVENLARGERRAHVPTPATSSPPAPRRHPRAHPGEARDEVVPTSRPWSSRWLICPKYQMLAVTTHPYYQWHARRERSEWPPAGCNPGSPWTADSLRCGNRLGRTCGCGSTPRLSA